MRGVEERCVPTHPTDFPYHITGHFHAVSSLANGNTFGYDSNSNMTSQLVYEDGSWKDYTLSYDAENRLTTVSGPVTANFKYDGDTGFAGASSKRVRATINGGLDTVFIGNYFEWNVATQTKRTYYFAGATRIAMRDNGGDIVSAGAGPQWILGEHQPGTKGDSPASERDASLGSDCYQQHCEKKRPLGFQKTLRVLF